MSAPPLDAVAATLRDFVARAGALRAVALLDRGAGAAPIVIDCDDAGAVEGEGGGEARGAAELAGARGGRSVATVQFQTSDPDAPLAVSARPGEPPVFALGDETF